MSTPATTVLDSRACKKKYRSPHKCRTTNKPIPATSIQCRVIKSFCFISVLVLRIHSITTRTCRQDKLQVADSHRPTLDYLQASVRQQRSDILCANMSVGTVKMRQKASLLITESLEVDDKHTSIRLQNPSNLSYTLLPCFLWQMVKHHTAQHYVELCVRKGKCFRHSSLKDDVNAGLSGFLLRPCEHLHRGIKPVHGTSNSDALLARNGERSRSAAYVKHRFATGHASQVQHFLSKCS